VVSQYKKIRGFSPLANYWDFSFETVLASRERRYSVELMIYVKRRYLILKKTKILMM
jgi:hypothetical protein